MRGWRTRPAEDRDVRPEPARRHPASPSGVGARLLALQATAGNGAVSAVLQRRRERPQSTDAPGRRGSAAPKPAPDYAPSQANPKFRDWSDQALVERAAQEARSSNRNSLLFAAELYEEFWFRRRDRGVALAIYRVYKDLGDDARATFWRGVATGSIRPGAKAVPAGPESAYA